jgi:hypothetical protein
LAQPLLLSGAKELIGTQVLYDDQRSRLGFAKLGRKGVQGLSGRITHRLVPTRYCPVVLWRASLRLRND